MTNPSSDARISSISAYLLTLELRVPFTTSFGTYKTLTRPFVVVTTADGLRGVGEIPTLTDPAYKAEADTPSVVTSLKEFVLPSVARHQADHGPITEVEELHASYSWVKGAVFAKSGVEAALWDVIAQRSGQPLWQLWGGTRRSIPVGVSIGGKTIDQILALAENAVGMGYGRLKVKIWPGFDVQVARALRERYPDVLLQVDANSAYDLSNWTRLKELDAFDLLLIEQPLFDDDIVLHSEIARELRTPICLDESVHSLRDAETAMTLWQRNDALDRLIINIKPPRVSGFSEAIAIAQTCHAAGVRTWIGGMLDTAWGKAFNLNLNALDAIELPGDHFSPSGAYFEEDIVTEPLVATRGVFALSDGVSAGVTLDWPVFERLGKRVYEQAL
ncbi:MAG: o-succinylbenzoate synthase [Thermomicrobiales bacterium]|jgi:O-succinylbenzoate synthase|nr:o-succinylbenzoate synthase [Thermomicrobiales bacterium]